MTLHKTAVLLFLLMTAVSCNGTRHSYFEKKAACGKFLTDKNAHDYFFPDKSAHPVVFYSISRDSCVGVTKVEMSGTAEIQGRHIDVTGTGRTQDLLTGQVLDDTPNFDSVTSFQSYERDMMKRYEAAD